jgi:hypothetical protein
MDFLQQTLLPLQGEGVESVSFLPRLYLFWVPFASRASPAPLLRQPLQYREGSPGFERQVRPEEGVWGGG